MTNLTIQMSDDLARRLEGNASVQRKTVRVIAIERLRSLVESDRGSCPGSPAALLRAVMGPPHPAPADVEEIDNLTLISP